MTRARSRGRRQGSEGVPGRTVRAKRTAAPASCRGREPVISTWCRRRCALTAATRAPTGRVYDA